MGGTTALGCGSNEADADEDEGPAIGGQTGEESVVCQPVERDMLAWSERSALGFSADELLNALGSESDGRLAWSAGGSTPVTLSVERASGSVEFQVRDFVDDDSGAEPATEIGLACNDVVAIPATFSFATADGAFAEQWPLTLLAESTTRVSTRVQVDVEDLEGTFTVTAVDPSRFDRVLAIFNLTFANGAWTGTLSGQAITGGSSDPESDTSAEHFPIASF